MLVNRLHRIVWFNHRSIYGNLYMKYISSLLRDEAGATAIEYGLLSALIGIAAMTAMQGLGGALRSSFNNTSSAMMSASA